MADKNSESDVKSFDENYLNEENESNDCKSIAIGRKVSIKNTNKSTNGVQSSDQSSAAKGIFEINLEE